MNRYTWKLLPPAPQEVLAQSPYPPLLTQLLYNRGLGHRGQWEVFLAGDERLGVDPFLLPQIELGLARLRQALLSGERMAVYGDYDTDGVTATALLVEGLDSLGARLIPYIPHRQEGHGLQVPVLERLYRLGATLVITADCGTTCYPEVAQAQKRGQDIIITDHHTPAETLPPALALINPKHPASQYPFPNLAGVGVAYKFLQAAFSCLGREDDLTHFCDLVALGTVADVVPLLGENRFFVKHGLKILNKPYRPGLRELIRLSGLSLGQIDAEAIAWTLGPRLNAAGRVEHASLSYRLLITSSPAEGQQTAAELEQRNAERQQLTEAALTPAREQAQRQQESKLLFISGKEFSPGVLGLVAGKLVDEFARPAIVIRIGTEACRGSCRSIPEFDMVATLQECSFLLDRYGGHPMAAGFTTAFTHLPRLHQLLLEKAEKTLSGVELRPQLTIDAQFPLAHLDGPNLVGLQQLAPFGSGNPAPTLLSPGVKVAGVQVVGGGEHLRLKLRAGPITWDAIGFGLGSLSASLTPRIDLVYNLSVDRWGNGERLELHILDLRPAQ